jgi:hypothetical protein
VQASAPQRDCGDVLLIRSPRLRQDRRAGVHRKPSTLTSKVLGSGDVLLSHGLSPHYHRGCSVSLPCSEWERVVPLRYCHQSAEPHWQFAAVAATQARSRVSGDGRLKISKEHDFQSAIATRKSKISSDPLTSTYRSSFRLRTADATTSSEFYLEIFPLSCLPPSHFNQLDYLSVCRINRSGWTG